MDLAATAATAAAGVQADLIGNFLAAKSTNHDRIPLTSNTRFSAHPVLKARSETKTKI